MNAKLTLSLFLAGAVAFTSCKKDDVDPPASPCRVVKEVVYTSGNPEDSAQYTYTNNQITRMDISNLGYVTFEYTSNRISRRNLFETPAGPNPDAYDLITYNADNTISQISTYDGTGSQDSYVDFVYSSGKLVGLKSYFASVPGMFELYDEYIFTYTGNNITTVLWQNTTGDSETNTYTFDTNANYLQKSLPQFMLTSMVSLDVAGELLPFYLSANNVAGVKPDGSPISFPVTYELNAQGNISVINFLGGRFISYDYNCP